jgi:hypothetical protein
MRYKKLIVGLFLIINSLSVTAQSADALDNKNGFNIFHLGSTIKEVHKLAKLKKEKTDRFERNIVRYSVQNIENYRLFDYALGKIQLLFYKDLLLEIQVYLPTHYKSDRDRNHLIALDIFKKIEEQYGHFQSRDLTTKDKLTNISEMGQIVGKEVTLLFVDFNPVTTWNSTTFPGMCYSFISAPVYNMQLSTTNQGSGL